MAKFADGAVEAKVGCQFKFCVHIKSNKNVKRLKLLSP